MRHSFVLRERVIGAAIAFTLSACSGGEPRAGDDADDGDAGADDTFPTPPDIPWLEDGVPPIAPPDIPWLEDGVPPIAPPDIPWLEDGVPPIAWTCPTGWRSVAAGGVVTCDPYPEGGAEACPDGEADFLGDTGGGAGCVPIGRACGSDTFPPVDDLPSDTPVRYVLTGAAAGGDGSGGSPYPTLAAALDDASPGTELVLGAGTYEVDRAWPDDVSVRGRCARETALVSEEAGDHDAVLTVSGGTSTARDLHIGPSVRRGVLATGADTRLELLGVWVTEATHRGVEVEAEADVEARLLVVDGTRELDEDLETRGLEVRSGASATIAGALFRRNRVVGVRVLGAGTTLQASDLGIVRSQPSSNRVRGWGLSVELGAAAVVERSVMELNRDLGVYVGGTDTTLELRDAVVRDTLPQESDGSFGRGLNVELGGVAVVERALVERNRDVGALAAGAGATLEVRNAVVRETLSRERDDAVGWGLGVLFGAEAVVEHTLIERNRSVGIFVSDPGTTLALRDAAVRETLSQEDDSSFGCGVVAGGSAEAVVERTVVEGNRTFGVLVSDSGTRVEFRDAVVRDTLPRDGDGALGWGFSMMLGSASIVERVLLERNRDVGIFASDTDTTFELRDTVVRDTLPQVSNGAGGSGIAVQTGPSAVVERALIERSREIGVFAVGRDTTIALRDTTVRDTLPRESNDTAGRGLEVLGGVTAEIDRALIEGNREVGIFAANPDTTLGLSDVVVRDTLVRASDGGGGAGLVLELGPTAVAERTIVERNRESGILASGPSTALTLCDSIIRDNLSRESDAIGGRGLSVQEGAAVTIERAAIERNREFGAFADGADTTLEMRDVVVRDTLAQERGGVLGQGIGVEFGASAVVDRALVEYNRDVGIKVGGADATLNIRDAIVRDTLPRERDGAFGRGLSVQVGASVVVERAILERNHELGVASTADATLELSDIVVRDTLLPGCAPSCASGLNYAAGLASVFQAKLTITDFVIEANDFCGVLLGEAGESDLDTGVVSDHANAVCLQVPGFDTARLRRGVQYVDNDRLIEATDLVLPEPAGAVDGARP